MHPRISANHICFPGTTIDEDIANWRSLGAVRVGLRADKIADQDWTGGIAAIKATGLTVATIVQACFFRIDDRARWPAERDKFYRVIEGAHTLRAETMYTTSGACGSLTWEAAADAFAEFIQPIKARAIAAGFPILIEPTNSLYGDLSFAHSLRDTVLIAETADIGVSIDIGGAWCEAGLRETIHRAAPRTHLMQLSDYVYGDRAYPGRAVPGDGFVPIDRILGWVNETGFKGVYDLELTGPRIDAEGHVAAVRRAAQWLEKRLAPN